ncbi:MAG: hypothetical protein ACEQSU_13985 [Microgenomates group bacterium]
MTPITHRGVTYPSLAALGRAYGRHRNTVRAAIIAGQMDTLGNGIGSVPVSSGGHHWRFLSACARELGVSPQAVWDAIENGRLDTLVARRMVTA